MFGISEVFLEFIEKLPEANKEVVAEMINELTDRGYNKLGECLKAEVPVPEYLEAFIDSIFISMEAEEFTWQNCTKERKESRFEFK